MGCNFKQVVASLKEAWPRQTDQQVVGVRRSKVSHE